MEELGAYEYFQIFLYFYLPLIIFALFLYAGIIISNRMGRENKLIVFFIRLIFIGFLVLALFYYFYYLVNFILIN